jgi:hypothetical protein
MAEIIRLRPNPSAKTVFDIARWEMNFALLEWLKQKPDTEDALDEIDATINALRQFRDLLVR